MKVDFAYNIEGVRSLALRGEDVFFSVANRFAHWSNDVVKELKTYGDSRTVKVFNAGSYVIAEGLGSADVWDVRKLRIANTLPPAYESFHIGDDTVLRYFGKQNDGPRIFTAVDVSSGQTKWEASLDFVPQLNGCVGPDFFAFGNSDDRGKVCVFDSKSGRLLHQLDLNRLLSGLYAQDEGLFEMFGKPECLGNILILRLQKFVSHSCYVVAVDMTTSRLKWHHRGWSDFAIHGNKVFNLEYEGWFRKADADTGVIEEEVDLKKEFVKNRAEAERAFTVTDKYLVFKYAPKGTFGIMDLKTMKIVATVSLTGQKVIMDANEPPLVSADRIYLRSTMPDNLFVYRFVE